jgi:preprotein translocase subunit SecY
VLENFLNAWRVPDLRTKLLFTAAMLAVYRLGSHLPAPGVDPNALSVGGSSFLNLLNTFSGGGLTRLSIFALGIMPYITASIILQVMTPVFPSLQALQKEGELGQRRITQYTRYLTVALAAAQSLGYAYAFASGSSLLGATSTNGKVLVDQSLRTYVLVVMTLTAGAALLMWIGELITQRGIGNGMSLLIFASILTSAPAGINAWWNGSGFEKLSLPLVILAVITGVVYVQEGIRKIPIQYAKRMVGRRMTSGGSTYLPLRVNMAGVIPVIFASAIMILPGTVAGLLPGTLGPKVAQWFAFTSWPYIIGESVLIFAFTFFYVAVVFNSLEQADNLKKYGGFIPGIRPGRPTAQYLESVLVRLTVAGSLFLAVVAAAPTLFIKFGGFSQATARALGGTSVLIVVGVAIDTMRQIESQLSMRSYKGFLK